MQSRLYNQIRKVKYFELVAYQRNTSSVQIQKAAAISSIQLCTATPVFWCENQSLISASSSHGIVSYELQKNGDLFVSVVICLNEE